MNRERHRFFFKGANLHRALRTRHFEHQSSCSPLSRQCGSVIITYIVEIRSLMHTEVKSFAQVTKSVSGGVIADLRCDLKLPYQYLNYYTEIRKHISRKSWSNE